MSTSELTEKLEEESSYKKVPVKSNKEAIEKVEEFVNTEDLKFDMAILQNEAEERSDDLLIDINEYCNSHVVPIFSKLTRDDLVDFFYPNLERVF